MEGFFTRKETESKTRPKGKALSCTACGLYNDVVTPQMAPFGNFKKGIMNIGEAPNELDDKKGKPWQGKSGRLLQRIYANLGIDLFEDCININAANCRPINDKGSTRLPTNLEIDNCRRLVLSAIKKYKPKVIILYGNLAVYSVIGHRWKKDLGDISKWRGWTIPDQDFNAWICPTFSPNWIEKIASPEKDYKGEGKVYEVIWKNDIEVALSKLNIPLPIYKEPIIDIIENLDVLNNPKLGTSEYFAMNQCAVDYETTGLKPHGEGHKIICAAVADSEDHAYVFMMPKKKKDRLPFINFLTNPKIAKIAQNMKYEHTWSKVILGVDVAPWGWDTMIASHVLDNRPSITGLKFQTYVQFGIVDYDSEISPYLKSIDDSSANAINRIEEILDNPEMKIKLLKYCALDTIYEMRLANIQRKILLESINTKIK